MQARVIVTFGAAVVLMVVAVLAFRRQAQAPAGDGAATSTMAPDGRPMQVTDGVKHLVPLNEIRGGGPGLTKDSIPPIDRPSFTTLPEVDPVLENDGLGLALTVDGESRLYPYQILVWHEIVNDTVGGTPVSVTYCPLCFTGIVFDRRVAGEETTFGTSGKLWQSNLVMYDRATDSYWSQVTAEAIVGERAGEKLAVIPADTMPLRVFKERFPGGKVLTTQTGARRDYTVDPYGDYYTSREVGFGIKKTDDRFHPKEIMLGFVLDGTPIAVRVQAVLERGEVEARVNDARITARADRAANTAQVFVKRTDGSEERVPAFPVFWFSWFAARPGTTVIPES